MCVFYSNTKHVYGRKNSVQTQMFRHKCSDTNVQTQKERHLHCRTFMYANAKASVKWRRWDSNP